MAGFQPANCSFLSICETWSWAMRHFEEDCPLKLVDVRPGRADHMGTGSFARNGTNRFEIKKGSFLHVRHPFWVSCFNLLIFRYLDSESTGWKPVVTTAMTCAVKGWAEVPFETEGLSGRQTYRSTAGPAVAKGGGTGGQDDKTGT